MSNLIASKAVVEKEVAEKAAVQILKKARRKRGEPKVEAQKAVVETTVSEKAAAEKARLEQEAARAKPEQQRRGQKSASMSTMHKELAG